MGLLGDIAAPPARPPARPSARSLAGLTATPDFSGVAGALSEVKSARERLQLVVSAGRQRAFVVCARLQRSDFEGARAALAEISALPSLQEAIGHDLWNSLETRLILCQSCNYGGFLATYLASQGLQLFLEEGQLTPEFPQQWRTDIQDFDDEWYLTGVIDGLREIERYAVNQGQALDLRSVRICLGAAQCLEESLMQFNFRNSSLRQRFDGVKYAVKRLESLAYEIDLARQRLRCTAAAARGDVHEGLAADDEEPAVEVRGPIVIDLRLIGDMKSRYDIFDQKREQSMKRSRDVVKMAKNAIYALQRRDYKKADTELVRCAEEACSIYEEMPSGSPTLRLGFFSGALEELAEALSYRAFRRDRALLGLEEMQAASGLSFRLLESEYIGGLMDLTGEVGRLAIRSASRGKRAQGDIEACLACVDTVYNGVQELPYLPGSLGKKMGPLKSTLTKIEGALYELALLSDGFSAPRGGGGGGDAEQERERED